jgi:hypothetical protein
MKKKFKNIKVKEKKKNCEEKFFKSKFNLKTIEFVMKKREEKISQ